MIMNGSNEKVIGVVIAPDRHPEKTLLSYAGLNIQEWSYVCVAEDCKVTKNNGLDNNTLFVLINQNQKEKNIAECLCAINKYNNKIIVWTHQTEDVNEPFSCDQIREYIDNAKLTECRPFSHNGEPILDFMEGFNNVTDSSKRKKIFDSIISDCINRKTDSDVHVLRAEILTPFMPFHLAYQKGNIIDDDWQKILRDCVKEINEGLKDVLAKLTEKTADVGIKQKLEGYIDKILLLCKSTSSADEEKKEEIVTCIENFAACLENVVNYIEFGDAPECR
jgi:hypothetical protein